MTKNQTPQASPKASFTQHCRQEAETAKLAQEFATALQRILHHNPNAHLNVSLEGDLGTGKTTFARHLIQGLGHEGRVKSPTYTLYEPYPILQPQQNATTHPFTVHHFDLYRMRDPLEWQEVGFAEHFDVPGLCLIEWPEKAEGTLPQFDIQIQLVTGTHEDERPITINAISEAGKIVIDDIQANPS
ncbi:tRNA (adenosine(37)-N6)-threonylcarbamoyltransferase complex ATPase subunit type 1 TsaE [Polynucleobacter necessarius]|uniref:tRNA (adenosine(37)-N6)-threonylcarbamoyltransferase complex ATPase subunit type 1 TsaE n=1 Tax=Polynucleobacter necessarius TaxID=576610 RepID=UPI000E09CC7C|nr:tRNA (adenosine(37)-N6)-threonylcarbamoyltransferase complex ATPase subunit type 1 TsaE [Polynucleobacter necessarius]HAT39490.1 tRNA (adenosine(37)-N6)-threonylcarbamoyltransferase complex ATPase subunit type 1 TsaE [Polynucleobacter sp.]